MEAPKSEDNWLADGEDDDDIIAATWTPEKVEALKAKYRHKEVMANKTAVRAWVLAILANLSAWLMVLFNYLQSVITP